MYTIEEQRGEFGMIRQLWGYFGKNKAYAIIACTLVVVETILELLIPMVMIEIIDVGVKNQDLNFIIHRGIIMILLAIISLVLGLSYAHFAALASQGVGANLREAMYRKIQQFSFANMDNFSESTLVTRLTGDVTIIQRTIGQGIRPFARGPIMAGVAFILTLRVNMAIAMIFLVSAPLLSVVIYFVIRHTRPWYKKTQIALDKINLKVQETLVAIRVVKSYVRGDYEKEAFAKITGEYQEVSQKAFHFAVMNAPLLQVSMYATTVAILWIGGNLIPEHLKVGELIGCLSYVLQILNGLMIFSMVFTMFMRAIASIERVEEVLNEPILMTDTATREYRIQVGEIEFQHVSFQYSAAAKEEVLTDINLHIPAGQTLGVVGGTGSAKSSLVQLLPRLYDTTKGCIKIDGIDIKEYSLKNLREEVGIVLQKNLLFSGTIRDNLQWGDEAASDEMLDKVCQIACASEFIQNMPQGYDTELGQGGVNLSGGQKQRLCIARALLKQPKILIFDDTTSAVDTATEARIREGIARELSEVTKIIISQRVASVQNAEQIVVLRDGKMDAVGTHELLLKTNEIYLDMYETQKRGVILS